MARILVVGSINIDLVMKAPRLPAPGETLVGGQFTIVPGGKGANQAAAAARLGCQALLVGAVGGDAFSDVAVTNLVRQGVDAGAILRKADASTGVAMIIVDAMGENTILVASGANAMLSPEDVCTRSEAFHWTDCVIVQCEVPLDVVAATIASARAAGKLAILNAAPAVPDLPAEAWHVPYLVVNEQEAASLSGIRPNSVESAILAAASLSHHGAEHVVVTLGAMGCVHYSATASEHIPAPKVEVVDTTAAGDAFVGALAAALVNGLDPHQALVFANCAGALATTKLGAQPSLPDAEAVESLYRQVAAGPPF